jgi:hypothetical protein
MNRRYDVRSEYGKWIKGFSRTNNNEDYKLKVTLSFKNKSNSKSCRNWVNNLCGYLKKNGIRVNGFMSVEYDSDFYNLHCHLLLWCNVKWSDCKSKIFNYWNRIGSVDIERYDVGEEYGHYIMKHIGKSENNDWCFIDDGIV